MGIRKLIFKLNIMKTLFKWFAGFFEDQKGSASSKRGTLYIVLGFFYMQVKASVAGTLPNGEMNKYILYGTIVFLLFLTGAITSEFFNKINLPIPKEPEQKP